MSRNLTYSALTLRVKASGESNREAWFLTAEEGIVKAVVFGGPKSRLRARVSPFHEGKLWVYHDPVRDSRKVSDFDVHSYRSGIRELYERIMTANAVAETVLAFHGGGGSWPEASRLTSGVLDALEVSDAAAASRVGLYFLWHWAGILGLRHGFSVDSASPLKLNPGAELWLRKIEKLPAAEVLRVSLDISSFEQAKNLCQTMLAEALGRRLSGWDGI